MYTSFFGLTEKPFSITPDPRYLYLSERHAEALAHLLYGIEEAGGFIQLTGEVGTGKTTVVRCLLNQIPAHADVALILNPRVTPQEFLLTICDELRITLDESASSSVKTIVDTLNKFLLDAHARGRRVVVLVDEAQQLSVDVLEQVRLLTNLETDTHKLLQIILVGQPELRELLERNDLRQLAQRITGRYHLEPLSKDEVAAYVRHRLKVAGATSEIFSESALAVLARSAQGIPRLINIISDRALLGAFSGERLVVTPALVRRAAQEVGGVSGPKPLPKTLLAVSTLMVASLTLGGLWLAFRTPPPATQVTVRAPATPTPTPIPTPSPTLLEFIAEHAADTGTDPALGRLFTLWGLTIDPSAGRPCDQGQTQGYECLAQKGTLAELAGINRPVILSLVLPDGAEHQVVLSQLDDRIARIDINGVQQDVALAELSRYWFGEFLLLWHPPVSGGRLIKPSARGAEILWLRRAIAVALNKVPATSSDQYDRGLQEDVEKFQQLRHLRVDGIVGQETQLLLDALVAAPGTPLLAGSTR